MLGTPALCAGLRPTQVTESKSAAFVAFCEPGAITLVWQGEERGRLRHEMADGRGRAEVTGIEVHPSGQHALVFTAESSSLAAPHMDSTGASRQVFLLSVAESKLQPLVSARLSWRQLCSRSRRLPLPPASFTG